MPARRLRFRSANRPDVAAFIREQGGRDLAVLCLTFLAARIALAGYELEFLRALIAEFGDDLPPYATIRQHVRELEGQTCRAGE